MTVASELIKLKENLTDSYTAVENKGGTLPQAQNFDNLPDAIDSITTGGTINSLNITPTTSQQTITASGGTDGYSPITVDAVTSSIDANIVASNIKDGVTILGITGDYQGSGGDTIFLPNESGETLYSGSKVLCNLGSIGSVMPASFTHSNSNLNYLLPILFFDDAAFLTTDVSWKGYMHTCVDGMWSSVTDSSLYQYWGLRTVYMYHNNGVISGNDNFANRANGHIYTKSGRIQLPQYYQYLGEYNNVHYCFYSNGRTICIYDKDSNTVGSTVATVASTVGDLYFGQLVGNKCIVQGRTALDIVIYEIDSAGVFTLLNTTTINSYPLYATGGNVGDYIFTTDTKEAYGPQSSYYSGHLFCYQIQSDYSLLQVSLPMLQIFETTPCYACYDNRNDVLSIGTADNVYFYHFDRYSYPKVLTNLNVAVGIFPTNPNSRPFRTMISPDKNTVVIMSDYNYVNVYRLTTPYHRIVPNSSYNYNTVTSITGFATGQTDSEGKYEISTILPDVVNYTISSRDVEPDEVNIYGGAE